MDCFWEHPKDTWCIFLHMLFQDSFWAVFATFGFWFVWPDVLCLDLLWVSDFFGRNWIFVPFQLSQAFLVVNLRPRNAKKPNHYGSASQILIILQSGIEGSDLRSSNAVLVAGLLPARLRLFVPGLSPAARRFVFQSPPPV